MNFLDKRRTNKLTQLIFHKDEYDKRIKFDYIHEIINNANSNSGVDITYANIDLNDNECKIFRKIKKLDYFTKWVLSNFNFIDESGKIFSSKTVKYFYDNNTNKYKIKITLK